MRLQTAVVLLCSAVLAAACASQPGPVPEPTEPAPTAQAQVPAGADPFAPRGGMTRVDDQGAVVVEVTPLSLQANAATLEFEIVLNTHSVDLSMDLAPIATLTTDAGVTVAANLWDAPRGGHHVSGKLTFPGFTDAGVPVLEGARTLTLTISGLDAPERVFEWDLR